MVARGVRDGAGIFERCCYLRGYDGFLLDMCTGEDLARLLLEDSLELGVQILNPVQPREVGQRVWALGAPGSRARGGAGATGAA